MVRTKIEIKKIDDKARRRVTFSKRRAGVFKKAQELSVLCDAEVGVLVFSSTNKRYEYSSSSMNHTIERYRRYKESGVISAEPSGALKEFEDMKNAKEKIVDLKNKYMQILTKEHTLSELGQVELLMNELLLSVRQQKEERMQEQLDKSIKEHQKISLENALLSKRVAELRSRVIAGSSGAENIAPTTNLLLLGPADDGHRKGKAPIVEESTDNEETESETDLLANFAG